jgi:hypothetical protein
MSMSTTSIVAVVVPGPERRAVLAATVHLARELLKPLVDEDTVDRYEVADALYHAATEANAWAAAKALEASSATVEADQVVAELAHLARTWRALLGDTPPPMPPSGLDARPVLRYTVHCSHCGVPAPGYEFNDACLWAVTDLGNLGGYHLSERGWKTNDGLADPDFGGRALACPACWEVAWCEDCDEPIHAWQRYDNVGPGHSRHRGCGADGEGQRRRPGHATRQPSTVRDVGDVEHPRQVPELHEYFPTGGIFL